MSNRELVVLGTASQAPTRSRNHNGYFLRWDDEGLLFDPGEGTQRQMLFAGVTASQITRICVTHFHGDHCLGLPGVLQRISLDQVPHAVEVCYPAESQEVFGRLRHASLFRDRLQLRERPVGQDGPVTGGAFVPPGGARPVAQRADLRLPAGRAGRAADAPGEAGRVRRHRSRHRAPAAGRAAWRPTAGR